MSWNHSFDERLHDDETPVTNQAPPTKEAGDALKLPANVRKALRIFTVVISQLLYVSCPFPEKSLELNTDVSFASNFEKNKSDIIAKYLANENLDGFFSDPDVWRSSLDPALLQARNHVKLLAFIDLVEKAAAAEPDGYNQAIRIADMLKEPRQISSYDDLKSNDIFKKRFDNFLLYIGERASPRTVLLNAALFASIDSSSRAGHDILDARFCEFLKSIRQMKVLQPGSIEATRIIQVIEKSISYINDKETAVGILSILSPERLFTQEDVVNVVMPVPKPEYQKIGSMRMQYDDSAEHCVDAQYYSIVFDSAMRSPTNALQCFVENGFKSSQNQKIVEALIDKLEAMAKDHKLSPNDKTSLDIIRIISPNRRKDNPFSPYEKELFERITKIGR